MDQSGNFAVSSERNDEMPLKARAFVLESGQVVVSDVVLRSKREAREWIAFTLIVALALLVGVGLSPFRDKRESIWSGQPIQLGLSGQSVPASTALSTATDPQIVIVITLTGTATTVPGPTKTSFPTSTPYPVCLDGLATPGRICVATALTSTPIVATALVVYPGTEAAKLGAKYVYPTEVAD